MQQNTYSVDVDLTTMDIFQWDFKVPEVCSSCIMLTLLRNDDTH